MPTKIFIWDELSDNVMFETDENNNVQVAYTHRPEKFGEVLYHKAGARYTYYHYDGNGSTNKLTGDTATVTRTYIFTGFGELVASPGVGSTPFAYKGAAGYYTNPVTNDIYVRARTYEPTIGRWLSKDPLGFVDGPNLYQAYFVPGTNDPLGLDTTIIVPCTQADHVLCDAACKAQGKPGGSAGQCTETWWERWFLCFKWGGVTRSQKCKCAKAREPQADCNPCVPPVGSICYRVDTGDSPPHGDIDVPHSHMLQMNQSPAPVCRCFWSEILKDPIPGEYGPECKPAGGGGPRKK